MSATALPLNLGPSALAPNARSDRAAESPRNADTAERSRPAASASTPSRASDTVALSPEARQSPTTAVQGSDETADTENNADPQDEQTIGDSTKPRGKDGEPLTDEEVKQVDQLKARDAEVRRHEQAHVAAGGPYVTSGPTYEYQQGPDGKRYAVGGSVGIDTSPEDTPEKTITKAQTVRRAALAPAEPSAQDRRVAAQASQLEQEARAELATERQAQTQQNNETNKGDAAASSSTGQPTLTAIAQQLEQAYASVPASAPIFRVTA